MPTDATSASSDDSKTTRREITKAVLYTVPVILSLKATPAFAQEGSGGTGLKEGDGDDNHGITWPNP